MDAREISFGWDRATDERSLAAFLQRFSRPALLEALLPRLSDPEIGDLVDHLSRLMRRHLSEGEYHRLFLFDPNQTDGSSGRPLTHTDDACP
ncbi:MAG: hypothetical protein M0T76_10405 [Desulfobacteraceae bacterium]|nr:hypothetical protein [Desulfobacteraceae bacterium]